MAAELAASKPTTETHELKILALLRSEPARAEVLYALKPLAEVAVQIIGRNADVANFVMPDGSTPTAVLFDADVSNPEDLEQIRELKKAAPIGSSVVALTDRATDLAALRAIRAGADDVLLKPIETGEAREVLGRVRHLNTDDHGQTASARTLVFIHVAGGAGATTLAVNAAFALTNAAHKPRTCLLDLDIQFGTCASLLDLPTTSPIENLFEDPERLDREMLDSMMLRHASGLRILTAPKTPLPFESFDARLVGDILRLAKRSYQYIIVDMPVALAPWTETALRSASTLYLVSELSVPAVHRINRLFDLFRDEDLTQVPLKIVLNKQPTSITQGSELTVSQFAKAVGRQVDYIIPDDHALISSSHNHGRPALQLKPTSLFATRLEEMLNKDLGGDVFEIAPRGWRLSFRRA